MGRREGARRGGRGRGRGAFGDIGERQPAQQETASEEIDADDMEKRQIKHNPRRPNNHPLLSQRVQVRVADTPGIEARRSVRMSAAANAVPHGLSLHLGV